MSKPKYKKGDRLVYMDENPEFTFPHDDNMVVDGDAIWEESKFHPKGGYWSYPIKGKANNCPEDFLTPYVEGQEEYTVELPCHVYFKERNNKNIKTMWEYLNEEQKKKYKEYCDNKYGPTFIYSETREPLYMDEVGNLINTDIIIDLLFSKNIN